MTRTRPSQGGIGTISLTSGSSAAASNATALQTAITAGGYVGIATPGIYQLNATMNVPSNTTIYIGRGVILVRVDGGNACTLFQNSDFVNGNVNIKLYGEGVLYFNANKYTTVYDANTADCPYFANLYAAAIPGLHESGGSIYSQSPNAHGLYWNNVKNLDVGGGLFTMMSDKYETYACGISNFNFHEINIYSDDVLNPANGSTYGRDGIHIQGNSHDGVVQNITGTVNDDFMVCNVRDVVNWAITANATGNIYNIIYRNIRGKNQRRGGCVINLYSGLDTGTVDSTSKGTATITIAAPGVVTLASHGLVNGDVVFFDTTGALPTGLAVRTGYYVVQSTTNTFQLSSTAGTAGASITTTGSQSGTHTLWAANRNGGVTVSNGFDIAPAITGIAAVSGGVYTVTTGRAHLMQPGQRFTIYNSNPTGFNTGGTTFAGATVGVLVGTVIATPSATTFTYSAPGGSGLIYTSGAILCRYYRLSNITVDNAIGIGGYEPNAVGFNATTDSTKAFGVVDNIVVRNSTAEQTNITGNGGVIGGNYCRLIDCKFDTLWTTSNTSDGLFNPFNGLNFDGTTSWKNCFTAVPYIASTVGGHWAGFANIYSGTFIIEGFDTSIIAVGSSFDDAVSIGSAYGASTLVTGCVNRQAAQLSNSHFAGIFGTDVGTISFINPVLISPSGDTRLSLMAIDGAVTGGNIFVQGLNLSQGWYSPMIFCYGVGVTISLFGNRLTANVAGQGGFIQYYNAGTLKVNSYGNALGTATLYNSNSTTTTVTTNTEGTLKGTTGSIGGGALLVGAVASGTVTVQGATVGTPVYVSPNTYPGDGFFVEAMVTSSNTVTVRVHCVVAGTPAASTYNVAVNQ